MSETLERIAASWTPPTGEAFKPYILPARKAQHPELDPAKLQLELLTGDARSEWRVLTTGDASILLRYRGREGQVSSVQEKGPDLQILQFQGAKQEGLRVNMGLQVAKLMADQIRVIASSSENPFERITMPHPTELTAHMSTIASHDGVLRIPSTIEKYYALIAALGMRYSDEEQQFIVEKNKLKNPTE